MSKLRSIFICFYGDTMYRYFNSAQIPVAVKAFNDAEKLVLRHFHMEAEDLRKNKYEVKTLAFLQQHEVKNGAFAHLCKYAYEKTAPVTPDGKEGFDFYRICLQDNSILDAVERANSFIKLSPLMLYIAVHELIHVIRFGNGTIDFDASEEVKAQEETIVHNLTRDTLKMVRQSDMDIVLDCFSNQFAISDICN